MPGSAETGYGSIEAESAMVTATLAGAVPVPVPIQRFVEKPDRATAEEFLASGRFTWNSGMFLFRLERSVGNLRPRRAGQRAARTGAHRGCPQLLHAQ